MLNEKSVLITGGTGSLGRALVKEILNRWPSIRRLIVFSRDELKQYEMRQQLSEERFPSLRFFLGDVRDLPRLRRAFNRVDVVIHAAALKQVPAAEYNPMEFVRTNVIGAENVIEAAIDAKVATVVALSTDKAAAPVNLYGATKLCSDKLFVAAQSYAGSDLRCAIVRYGNVMASRGSVIPFFLEKAQTGTLPITHPDMTRFNISLQEGVDLVLWAIEHTQGGEIFIPKIPSMKITELANCMAPGLAHREVGIRPGEKLHEVMISEDDARTTIEFDDRYAILAPFMNVSNSSFEKFNGKSVSAGFRYASNTNTNCFSPDDFRKIVMEE